MCQRYSSIAVCQMCDSPVIALQHDAFVGSPAPPSPERFNGKGISDSDDSNMSNTSTSTTGSVDGKIEMTVGQKRVFRNLTGIGTLTFHMSKELPRRSSARAVLLTKFRPSLTFTFSDPSSAFVELEPVIAPAKRAKKAAAALKGPKGEDLCPIKTQILCAACHSAPVQSDSPLCQQGDCKREPEHAYYSVTFEDRRGEEQRKDSWLGLANVLADLRADRWASILREHKGCQLNKDLRVGLTNADLATLITPNQFATMVIKGDYKGGAPIEIFCKQSYRRGVRIARVATVEKTLKILRTLNVGLLHDSISLELGELVMDPDVEWYRVPRFHVQQCIAGVEGATTVASTY